MASGGLASGVAGLVDTYQGSRPPEPDSFRASDFRTGQAIGGSGPTRSFTVRDHKAYEGRNPRTGDTVHVKPKRLAFFKVGKELRERVNRGKQGGGPGELTQRPQLVEPPPSSS